MSTVDLSPLSVPPFQLDLFSSLPFCPIFFFSLSHSSDLGDMLRVEQKWPSGVKSSGKAGERGQRALLATSLFTTAKMTLSLALRRWLVGRRAGPFVWHRCRSGGSTKAGEVYLSGNVTFGSFPPSSSSPVKERQPGRPIFMHYFFFFSF